MLHTVNRKSAGKPLHFNSFDRNTDSSTKGDPEISGAGGIIRDASDQWVLRFSCSIGVCSITQAELWGLRTGLMVAWNAGIQKLTVETDYGRHSVDTVSQQIPCFILLVISLKIINRDWDCSLVQTYHRCAYALANLSHENFGESFIIFYNLQKCRLILLVYYLL
ncbi:RVT_3 domain-containing protein [Cephalotus follicularis]|uniref:RVT_3 domain-containing protein n=1 Tax=Cephalotus follicularis TaxID=3775 RepID=A0A1Q3D1Q7_CEPFO|nr:RVT_3 domain-containing protein [Cephalotus follicularis]